MIKTHSTIFYSSILQRWRSQKSVELQFTDCEFAYFYGRAASLASAILWLLINMAGPKGGGGDA